MIKEQKMSTHKSLQHHFEWPYLCTIVLLLLLLVFKHYHLHQQRQLLIMVDWNKAEALSGG